MTALAQGSIATTGTGGTNTVVATPAVSFSIVSPANTSEICLTDETQITPQPVDGAMPAATRNLIVKGKCAAGATVVVNGINAIISGNDWRADIPISKMGELILTATSGTVTVSSTIKIFELQITLPTLNQQFTISAAPAMPAISANVAIVGLNPDPTASKSFIWELTIGGQYKDRAGWQPYNYPFTGQTQGTAAWIPVFNNMIVGGWVKLQVKSQIGGREVKSDFRWIDVNGDNPSGAIVQQYIQTNGGADKDILQKIIHWESLNHQYLQFRSSAEKREPNDNRIPATFTAGALPGGPPRPGRPVFGAPPAGIGIAQMDPAHFPDQHWNWQGNVLAACQFYYNEKVPIATAIYHVEQSRLDTLRTEVLAIANWARSKQTPPQTALSLAAIPVATQSPFSPAELRRAKIRAYNGGFNYRLNYTYQLSPDNLTATLIGTGNWIEDPGTGYSQSKTTVTIVGKQFIQHTFTWRGLPQDRLSYVNDVETM